MGKTIAKLFVHAIKNNKLLVQNKDAILQNLSLFPVRTGNKLIKQFNITNKELELLCEELFSKYDSFVVIGCPLSTDLDVVCIVDNFYQSNGQTWPLLSTELERLKQELELIGYDQEKINLIDLNVITIKNSNITSLTKGGKETQNMIMATYNLHKQKYPCPNLEFVQIDILEKCRSVAKFMVDHLENISIDYQKLREQKKQSYESSQLILDFSKQLKFELRLDVNSEVNSKNINVTNWFDDMKSLVMKFCQLVLLKHKIYKYTKIEICESMQNIGWNFNSILWFLTRGKLGTKNTDVILQLYDSYLLILNEYEDSIIKSYQTIKFNEIILDILLTKLSSFFESPNIPTNKFEEQFDKNFFGLSVNSVFQIQSTLPENRHILTNLFDPEFHNNFIWTSQRSLEWLELLKFFSCGNNTKEIPEGFDGKFNLIRGAIAEKLISEYFCFEDFTKIELGLLVENTTKGSKGCAPDLLLIKSTDIGSEIIPVEIKCLKSKTKNSNYYDSFDLAQKQCQSVKTILDNFGKSIIQRKIIILSWFFNDCLEFEINVMNF